MLGYEQLLSTSSSSSSSSVFAGNAASNSLITEEHNNYLRNTARKPNGATVDALVQASLQLSRRDKKKLGKKGGKCLATWEKCKREVSALKVLDNRLILSGHSDGEITCWEMDQKTGEARYLATWDGHQDKVSTFVILDSRWVLSGSWDATIKWWETDKKTGKARCRDTWSGYKGDDLEYIPDSMRGVSSLIALDERRILSASQDGTIKCWEIDKKAEKSKCLNAWKGHEEGVSVIAILSKRRILSASADGPEIKCWAIDKERGEAVCLETWMADSDWVYSLAVLEDGLVLIGIYEAIECWKIDEETGKATRLDIWECNWGKGADGVWGGGVEALAILPNKWVLSEHQEAIQCLEVDKETSKIKPLELWKGHTGRVSTLQTLDKGWVLSGSEDYTIKCWEGIQSLIKIIEKSMFDLLKIARIFLVQEVDSSLPIEIKFEILEKSIGEARKFLPKALILCCLNYAANRSTLHENALSKEEFLSYLGLKQNKSIETEQPSGATAEIHSESALGLRKREREINLNFLGNPWERQSQRIKVGEKEEVTESLSCPTLHEEEFSL
ncbi:MAG: hypothetical protein K0R12_1218 [Gammaproteobacteria bacterium]|jgi:WD40 repeat protein|nr:hypothetical protein [Gammaproteobacteria bacterium]